jgi:hypothetical protein
VILHACVVVIDPMCIGFVTFEDYKNTMAKECKIMVHRCLLERLKVDGPILLLEKFPKLEIFYPIFSTLHIAKFASS